MTGATIAVLRALPAELGEVLRPGCCRRVLRRTIGRESGLLD